MRYPAPGVASLCGSCMLEGQAMAIDGHREGSTTGARARFTLSFVDRDLESLYQADGVVSTVREAPLGTAASIFLWLVRVQLSPLSP